MLVFCKGNSKVIWVSNLFVVTWDDVSQDLEFEIECLVTDRTIY